MEARLRKPDGTYGWDGAYGTYWWVNRKAQMVAVIFVQTPGRPLQYDFDNAVSQAVIEWRVAVNPVVPSGRTSSTTSMGSQRPWVSGAHSAWLPRPCCR